MAKNIDWDYIRTEYEETPKSIRQIARENCISHGAIIQRANANKDDIWIKFNPKSVVNDKALVTSKNPILGKIALRKIKEIKDILGENMSPLDEPLIVIFAKAYEKWVTYQAIIEDEGDIAVSSKGSEYLSPYFEAAARKEKTLITISNQLGLSISSRKKIGITPKSDTDEPSLFDDVDEMYSDFDV